MEQKNENENIKTEENNEQGGLSMDVLREIKRQALIGLISTILVALIIGAICAYQMTINYKNDISWKELFNSYDFVSQDGNGENYYNNDVGGNVNNGAESKDVKK